jgi:hypothetical protein
MTTELRVQTSNCICTVKGELGVARFLVNSFKRAPLPDACGCVPLPALYSGYRRLLSEPERSQFLPNLNRTLYQFDDFALEKTSYVISNNHRVRSRLGTSSDVLPRMFFL